MGAPDRGTYSGRTCEIRSDGVYFGSDSTWRIVPGPNGPVFQNDAAATYTRPSRYVEVNSTQGPVAVATTGGARSTNGISISANYTTVFADRGIMANASGGAITITLLPAATAGNAYHLGIVKTDNSANIVTIDANAAETINGALTYTLTREHEGCELESNGTNWIIRHFSGDPAVGRTAHRIVTAAYTVTHNDNAIECNATSGAFTVTLPAVSGAGVGIGFTLGIGKSDSSANIVTIDGNGAETINGQVNYLLRQRYQGVELVNNGTEWSVKTEHPGIGATASNEATVLSGGTSVVVTHNAGYTPHSSDIHIVPVSDWFSTARWWISATSSTTFTITVNTAPTGGAFVFAWKIIR